MRAIEMDDLAIDQDLALVGAVQPVDDVHQGGFPGPVLAEKRVDFTFLQRQADVVVGDYTGEMLGDAFDLDDRSHVLLSWEDAEMVRQWTESRAGRDIVALYPKGWHPTIADQWRKRTGGHHLAASCGLASSTC